VETNRYYNEYLNTGWRMVPIVWYDCSENVFVFGNYVVLCRWCTIRGTRWKIAGRH